MQGFNIAFVTWAAAAHQLPAFEYDQLVFVRAFPAIFAQRAIAHAQLIGRVMLKNFAQLRVVLIGIGCFDV